MPFIPFKEIKYVLLDMDGTLLDRYFDDYFWEHLVPERYAEKHKITFGKAMEELFKRYKAHEGTLNWTDIDFWSKELDLDILALKEQIRHLIEVHPHVEDFLKMLKARRIKTFIVTNAHYKVLDMKLKKTDLGRYLTGSITSFEVGCPKEQIEFWQKAEQRFGFSKEKTMLVDDTLEVLKTAKKFGIKYLIFKARSNSKIEPLPTSEFTTIIDFGELIKKEKELSGKAVSPS
ncbi:MAG: HAD-IA family hydrolase [Thermodesulfovibrionales bacterium]|nr:HAD-IA family hydrolase [Thermodesulfovibrionales bacterium]